MIPLLLTLATAPLSTVRAEPVEARDQSATPATRPSTSSGRTVEGMTPIDAERAFAADARTLGQWTAFRKWSTDDAVMFVPQPTNAQDWLKDRKDPPNAINWWPTASYISCDGTLAVNTGGWKRPDGSVGYFTTVWQRQKGGDWKWTVDRGDVLETPRSVPATPTLRRAKCPKSSIAVARWAYRSGWGKEGASADGSLRYNWWTDGPNETSLTVQAWNGSSFGIVFHDVSIPK